MPRPPKTTTARVEKLEARFDELEKNVAGIMDGLKQLIDAGPAELSPYSAPGTTGHQCDPGIPGQEGSPARVEAPSVGREGREFVPEPEHNDLDKFLFGEGMDLLAALDGASNPTEAAQKVAQAAALHTLNWLMSPDQYTRAKFFILWFAAHEQIRKLLLFAIVVNNLPISEQYGNMLFGGVSAESLAEVKALFNDMLSQAQNPSQ